MHAPSRTRALAGLIAALVVATVDACGSSAGAPLTSPVVVVTAAPSATAAAPLVRSSVTPSAMPSAVAADPIPEGDYTTGPMTAEMMAAAAEAHGIDPDDARSFVANEGFKIHETVTMRLKDGALTLLQSLDGRTPKVGWDGTYAFADDATMIAGSGGYPITYGIRWEGDSLHLQVLKDAYPDPFDLIAQVALYESMPFTAVP